VLEYCFGSLRVRIIATSMNGTDTQTRTAAVGSRGWCGDRGSRYPLIARRPPASVTCIPDPAGSAPVG
jgi:hypothetical protein